MNAGTKTDAAPQAAATTPLELEKEHKLPTAVFAIAPTPDGKRVFAACFDGSVLEIDADSGKAAPIGKHDNYASGIAWLPQAGTVISAGYDGALIWHDPVKRERRRRVQAHQFWSWQMAVSPDERWVASVTGAYRSGGYRYEPAPETEPSVRIHDARTGELVHSLAHTPPVLSVAISPDNRHVAAGNMLGEVRIWDLETGRQLASWTTPGFTSWGIIKSHHYVGGIFSMTFSPDGKSLLLGGMGPMTDPMAGNGKQHWERFAWQESPPRKIAEISDSERGNGLMESLVFHPKQKHFVLCGRLAQGKWNTAVFDAASGGLVQGIDTKMRTTTARFNADGSRLFLGGAVGQEKKKDGVSKDFGRLKIYRCALV